MCRSGGVYYFAVAPDNATVTIGRVAITSAIAALGKRVQAFTSGFPLPSTLTLSSGVNTSQLSVHLWRTVMAVFEWTIPANLAPKVTDDTPDAVREYLTTGKGLLRDQDRYCKGNPFRFVIDAASDPTAALNAYTGQVSAKRDQFEKAKQLANDFQAKVLANQAVTTAETAKAVAAIITVVKRGGFDT
jgi:hypothetical protein